MPQYLLSVWHDEQYELDFSSDEAQRQMAQVGAFNEALGQAGALVFAGGLNPASDASVYRLQNGSVAKESGPYAKSMVQMGGFWVIQAEDDEAAENWARRGAAACENPVEVRSFQG